LEASLAEATDTGNAAKLITIAAMTLAEITRLFIGYILHFFLESRLSATAEDCGLIMTAPAATARIHRKLQQA
jgi:hypothetical protein